MSQSHAQIWIHIIFSTKERRTFLEDSYIRNQVEHHAKMSYQEETVKSARNTRLKLMSGTYGIESMRPRGQVVR